MSWTQISTPIEHPKMASPTSLAPGNNLPQAGRVQFCLPQWKELTQDLLFLSATQGYRIPFVQAPSPTQLPPFAVSQEETTIISKEIQSLLGKGAIQKATSKSWFTSNIFLVPKSGGKFRLILNLKALNRFVLYEHFKMEDVRCVKDLLSQGDYLCKLDLKDAYLSLPIHESSRKYLQFRWQGVLYEYKALPFGLSAAPRVFTKVLKPALAKLRSMGIRLVAYLDDLLIIGRTKREAEVAFTQAKDTLERLGFIINQEKSQNQASQVIEFLGFLINSREMSFKLPPAKVKQIRDECKRFLRESKVTVRELAHIVGMLVGTRLAVLPAPLHYRALQAQKIRGLIPRLSYESTVTLNHSSQQDLQWWINHLSQVNGCPIQQPPPTIIIESDASNTGWGARCGPLRTRGQWSANERNLHINGKEMLAAFLGLKAFLKEHTGVHVRLKIDNTTTVCYINRMGGAHSPQMMQLTYDLWNWSLQRNILLSAEHLPGRLNHVADQESRMQGDSSDWKLSPRVFNQLMKQMGPCEIDLFASRLTAQLPTYMSWRPDPEAVATDALAQPWNFARGYAFPPFALIGRCLNKVHRERVPEMVLVTPIWPTQTWFPMLVWMSIRRPILIPTTKQLLRNHKGESHPLISQGSLNLAAWLVSGDPLRQKEFQKKRQSLFYLPGDEIQRGHTPLAGEDGNGGALTRVVTPLIPH